MCGKCASMSLAPRPPRPGIGCGIRMTWPCPRPSMETTRLGPFGPFWAVLGRSGCWVFGGFDWTSFEGLANEGKWMHWWQRCWLFFNSRFSWNTFPENPRQWFSAFLTELETPVWNRIQNFPFLFFFAEATLAATARSWLTVGTQCSVRQPWLSNLTSFPLKDSTRE